MKTTLTILLCVLGICLIISGGIMIETGNYFSAIIDFMAAGFNGANIIKTYELEKRR